jgi:uncharacterized repeat protein (TIGR01451 family)
MLRPPQNVGEVGAGWRVSFQSFQYEIALRALFSILCLLTTLYSFPVAALPAQSGTWIYSVAAADYLSEGVRFHVQSQLIRARVSAEAAFRLDGEKQKNGVPGEKIKFRYGLTNSGNVNDRFDLALAAVAGGDFVLDELQLFADDNRDGLPDGPALASGERLTARDITYAYTTPLMRPGQSLFFVVSATLPPAPLPGSSARFWLAARGNQATAFAGGHTPAAQLMRESRVMIKPGGGIRVQRTLSPSRGPSPNTGLRVTLSYHNSGAEVSKLTLLDVIGASSETLPFSADLLLGPGAPPVAYDTTGLSYVAGSARWNGLAVALSEAPDGDEGGIQFSHDPSTHVLRAVIASVPAGASGTLSYLIDVKAGLGAGSRLTTGRTGVLWDAAASRVRQTSNETAYQVLAAGPNLILLGSGDARMFGGEEASLLFRVENKGDRDSPGSKTVRVALPVGVRFIRLDAEAAEAWACAGDGKIERGETLICTTEQIVPARDGTRKGAEIALKIKVRPEAGWFASGITPLSTQAQISGGGESEEATGDNTTSVKFSVLSGSAKRNLNGIVYDSSSRLPLAGVTLRLVGPAAFDPALHLLAGAGSEEQTTRVDGTQNDGQYAFALVGDYPAGEYRLELITVPPGYIPSGQSPRYPAQAGPLIPPQGCLTTDTRCSVEPSASPRPPPASTPPHYYTRLYLAAPAFDVINNHLPVDPQATTDSVTGSGLLVAKAANRKQVEVGELVEYSVRVQNGSEQALPAARLVDRLPHGFVYVDGSARLSGAAIPAPQRDVASGALVFSLGRLPPASTLTLSYSVVVGGKAMQGDGINRAQAIAGDTRSNVASARVKVVGGVFSDKAYLLGSVFADCNRDGMKDADEPGVPDVRLFLEDGTWVISDGEGRYSLYGLEPRTHVLKVDRITLPDKAQLLALDSRHAGRGSSRFADLKRGEMQRGDFALACTPEVMAEIMRRRSQSAEHDGTLDETERLSRASVFTALPAAGVSGDLRTRPAAGVVGGQSAAAQGQQGAAKPAVSPGRAQSGQAVLSDSGRPELATGNETAALPLFSPLGGSGSPGAGVNSANSSLPGASPQIDTPLGPTFPASNPLAFEKLLPELDNRLAFVDLKNGDILPMRQTHVRVKGASGTNFRLWVNDLLVPDSHVGKKSVLEDKEIQGWEYIGINLNAGENLLRIEQIDSFGQLRDSREIRLVAPAGLGRLHLDLPAERVADGRTPLKVGVRLTDAHDVPVTTRTPVTLESMHGVWQVVDLNPKEPGIQLFIEGGRAEFALLPPRSPAAEELRVSSGSMRVSSHFKYTPELRPLIAAGVLEGAFNLRNLDLKRLAPARERDSFEREIQRFTRESSDGAVGGGARAALFLKGRISGDYLLTLAYDSDKDLKERLFRDIQPDQFYPVYGDASLKGFDAQSSQRFYIRVDKGNSFVLYGDYPTAVNHPGRQLSQYSRALTGGKGHYESERISAHVFASQDTLRQFVEEMPANGTSGPYLLANKGFFINSEKVEILTRDRNQPELIIKKEALSRFSDYEIEPAAGRILFKRPLASRDENLNRNYIKVSYEVDQGGEQFWIVGGDGQVKMTDNFEVGAMAVRDANPHARFDMAGGNATLKIDDSTHLVAEFARTQKGESLSFTSSPSSSSSASEGTEGNAGRVELIHRRDGADMRAYTVRSGKGFDNPASQFNKGRSESGLKASLRVDEQTVLGAEAIHSENLASGAHRQGVVVNTQRDIVHGLKGEVGLRHSRDVLAESSSGGAVGLAASATALQAPSKITSARARLTAQVPQLAQVSVFTEYEQEIGGPRKTAGVGGDYRFSDQGRIYLKHNFINGITSPFALSNTQRHNSTLLGIETQYMKGGNAFSEYRVRDAVDGQHAEAALGLRNQYQPLEGVRINTTSEGIKEIGDTQGTGASSIDAHAHTAAAEYLPRNDVKLSGRVEVRRGTEANSHLLAGGVALRLDRDWTALTRAIVEHTEKTNASARSATDRQRFQSGVAYRDTATNRLSALSKYEYLAESSIDPSNPLERTVNMFSVHANWHPERQMTLTGRLAGKHVLEEVSGLTSSNTALLIGKRIVVDIGKDWDVGFQAALIADGEQTHYGWGPELGYRFADDLWGSVGYNFFGFRDKDFAALDYYEEGLYFRLRYKFDEDLFARK